VVDFSHDFPAITGTPTHETSGKISLRIFVDRSSIEVFGDDGRFVMTNLVFPTSPYSTLSVASNGGGARISNLRIYSLRAE
ncbi:MAG: GH32 C-terminal domain-containing protein, partial [Duncaniella sp.]|nr:GH32 C-terminal domain-containing protein [Duncaniella sp.]